MSRTDDEMMQSVLERLEPVLRAGMEQAVLDAYRLGFEAGRRACVGVPCLPMPT